MNGLKWVKIMELFIEQKNKNYGAVYDLLMEINRKPNKIITGNEISEFILERGLYTPYFENSLMNKCKEANDNLYILREVSKDIYTIDMRMYFPPPILDVEIVYLKHILKDERMKIFLDNSTIYKLKGLLKTYKDVQIGKYVEIEGISKRNHTYEKLDKAFILVLKSRKEKRIIKYTYTTKNGQIFKENFMIPYKIEYSIRDDKFYIIYYSIEQNKINKGIISNFSNMELHNYYEDYDFILKTIPFNANKQKVKEPIVIEIKDKENSVERAFHLLSCFEKKAYYDREKDIYKIYIYYYEYDEAEIISRILSLGKNAKVISPNSIRLEIIQRIKKSIRQYI